MFQERDRWLHTKKMKTLFEAADESGDGYIDARFVLIECSSSCGKKAAGSIRRS